MGRDDEQSDVGDEVDGKDAADDPDEEIDPDLVPTVIVRAADRDPMARAKTALRAARLARGADPDEPEPPPPIRDDRDPLARAASALDQAAAARAEALKGGSAGVARENRAREELQRLKGGVRRGAAPADPEAGSDGSEVAEPPPKKRRL
mgnify:CR=1 FL=1